MTIMVKMLEWTMLTVIVKLMVPVVATILLILLICLDEDGDDCHGDVCPWGYSL